ncbi:profilin-1 [Microcaecilia unicolor]|uniref:Profilin n=1 Tax=Microcaecilia unicolor TaxID=1415580 RepID=A0A6P7WSP4_9AMPH|nr:profilin-1 [Microcaecilia unicolor]
MSGWDGYIASLMATNSCQDAAIIGIEGTPCVWAAHPHGFLINCTPQEINMVTGKDRNAILIGGLTLGQQKISVIKDLFVEEGTIDARTKNSTGGPTYAVSINKTCKTLIIAVGKEGVHGGVLNSAVNSTVKYLRDAGY